nr:ribonuclease H-like domain, reverse transcriptase, RNA-dependent DNA polymerase [Tanacetum cinerariifolium]
MILENVNNNVGDLVEVKTASIPMETQKSLLKDEDGEEVDVHMYSDYAGASLDRKSTTGGCQFLGCRLISWQCKKHTVVSNSTEEAEYVAALSCRGQDKLRKVLIDDGKAIWNEIRVTTFWSTAMAKTINEEVQLHAKVDGKKIIVTESSVRIDLRLADEEGIDCLPNSTIFEQIALMGKPTRKDTQVPQSSGPTESVTDEAVHKELGDRLVRAATTASNLEAKHESGNITKSLSKATPNEPSSQGTDSGGGPRCQETIGDTIAQTRRVKKLEKRNRSRTHKLKRLYKVGLSAMVESFDDKESLGEDASKQGRRIDNIDADEDITLVNDADNEMFDVDTLGGEEVFVAGKNENIVEEVVDAAQVSSVATTVTITTKEITLAQALEALKTSKPKVKGIVFQEPEEHVKPKKKDQIRLDDEAALKLQAKFDEKERLAREKAKKEQEANIALIEERDDIQAKIDDDHQLAERMQAQK